MRRGEVEMRCRWCGFGWMRRGSVDVRAEAIVEWTGVCGEPGGR